MPTTHAALIYVRQSSFREESASLEMQETSAREHCARYGYHVVDVIQDPGVSGLMWDKRPGIQQVLKRIDAGDADRVIVWRWSRLSRKQIHQHLAIDRIETAGAVVESSTEPFDTKTAGGAFGRDVMLASAAFESKQKSEQWKETHDRRISHGLPASGKHRYGYVWHRGSGIAERYEINPEEAETVQWMFDSYINGMGVPGLARELNRRGVPYKNGRKWGVRGVTNILESGFAAGLLARNVTYPGTNQVRPFAERSWIVGAHDEIVDEFTWQRYKAVKVQRATTPPRNIHPNNVLSGLVKCADCGGPMVRRVNKTTTFACQRRMTSGDVAACNIQEWRLVALVTDWLTDIAEDVGEAAERAEQIRQAQLRTRADSQDAANRLAEVDRQLANLTTQLVAGRVPESAYEDARDQLLRQRTEAERQRSLAEATEWERSAEPAHVTARTLLDEWDALPVPALRTMLGKLIDHIAVTPPSGWHERAKPVVVDVWST